MENNFDIELQTEENNDEEISVQLPANFLTFGEVESDDLKVYIKQDVYKALEKLSASDTKKELGSILLGEYCYELGKTNVIISNFIEAKYTDASASTLTFTHETWDYIHSEHEKSFPDKKIIGWQHTHPNYGVFLSNYDMFIQENFFNLPFQIAYVIDPIQNIRGFFQWKNGKIEKLKGYYIYDDIGKPIKIEQIKTDNNQPSVPKSTKFVLALIFLLGISCLFLATALFLLKSEYQERLNAQEETVSQIQTVLEENNELIKQQDLMLKNQEKTIGELKAQQETSEKVEFVSYDVKEGDSLSSICAEFDLDYAANVKIIMAVNGIDVPDKIYAGQRLLVPAATKTES